MITSIAELLLGFDVDSACFAYSVDENKIYSTRRGMRALRHGGVNVVDTRFASPCYWRRTLFFNSAFPSGLHAHRSAHFTKNKVLRQ